MAAKAQPAVLQATEDDIQLLLQASCHLGSRNADKTMLPYIFKRRPDGINVINIGKTWEKLVFAARIIAAIENPSDIVVISARPYGHRAVLKFAAATGAQAIAGRFTPGSFTNYITRTFREPRLIIVTDPRVDHQAIREASYVNIPVIALADTDASLNFVDVAIPTNNKSKLAIGLIWWMLAREVLRLRGTVARSGENAYSTMVDMFIYRDPEEVEREQADEKAARGDTYGQSAEVGAQSGGAGFDADWDVQGAGSGIAGAVSSVPGGNVDGGLDWAADTGATDWSAPEPSGEWSVAQGAGAAPVEEAQAAAATTESGWA